MDTGKLLDKEMTHLWSHLNLEQKKEVLIVVKSFARKEEALIDDKAFVTEMNKRFTELEAGVVKGLSFEELVMHSRKKYRK